MKGFDKIKKDIRVKPQSKAGPRLLEAAVKLHKAGETRQAEDLYLRAIESGFHHEIAFSNLGVIYKNANRQKDAEDIYRRAIGINPRYGDAHE